MSNGTTDYQALCAAIADWANRADWSPALVASFVAMAESKFNSDLRVDRMIATSQALVTDGCAPLPDDWLESDLMLIAAPTATGWAPIRYKARDEFFRLPNTPVANYSSTVYPASGTSYINTTAGYYTIEGRTLFFGGPVDAVNGTTFQLNYFQEVPVMATAGSSWVYTKYPRLYLFAALSNADFHAVGEEQSAMLLGQEADKMIAKLNDNYRLSKASGSRLTRSRMRSFG